MEDDDDTSEFDEHQIKRTTRLGRRYAFKSFQSDRATNAKYPDECFYELQSYMSMTSCGTPQSARRFAHTPTREETPHGDTHLRTIKKFDEGQILGNFHRTFERTVNALKQTSALRGPVTVAIDTTEEPYWGEGMRRTSGSGKGDSVAYTTAHKYATLTIVGKNAPIILGMTPVVPSTPREGRIEKPKHQIVAELLVQALDIANIHMVLCDREFDAQLVWQVIDNLGLNYSRPMTYSVSLASEGSPQ